MSGEERQERPRRRAYKSLRHPEACELVDEYQELSCLAPEEIRRYMGQR